MWSSKCHPFGSTWVHPGFLVGFVLFDPLVFCVVLCSSLFACFLWAIVLSALLRFTVSDYTFDIFKLFLKQRRWIEIVSCHCTVALHYHFIRVTFNFQKRKFTIEHFCIAISQYIAFSVRLNSDKIIFVRKNNVKTVIQPT